MALEKLCDFSLSEKGFVFRREFEVKGHRGKKMEKQTADMIGEAAAVSGRTVQRYIRLTYLIPEFREMVDKKLIGMEKAVELSYYTKEEQEYALSNVESEEWKHISVEGIRSKGILSFLSSGNEFVKKRRVILDEKVLKNFFPENMTTKDIKGEIIQLLQKRQEDKRKEVDTYGTIFNGD